MGRDGPGGRAAEVLEVGSGRFKGRREVGDERVPLWLAVRLGDMVHSQAAGFLTVWSEDHRQLACSRRVSCDSVGSPTPHSAPPLVKP